MGFRLVLPQQDGRSWAVLWGSAWWLLIWSGKTEITFLRQWKYERIAEVQQITKHSVSSAFTEHYLGTKYLAKNLTETITE